MKFKNGWFLQGDCLEIMPRIPAGSVDMVLCDLPYGTTQNKWDAVIPFEPLWASYWKACKSNAAVVLTAAQPFTSALVMSQPKAFKYEWVWHKAMKTGQLNAKKRPLVSHETVLVFHKEQPTYAAYREEVNPRAGLGATPTKTKNYNAIKNQEDYVRPDSVTKDSVISGFSVGADRGAHPTQKPVALFEYLIRTYTNPGDIVLDNTAGSGTTAIAAIRAGRQFICIERDEKYYAAACERVTAEEDQQS